ncbi:uncharacterized protein LOC111017805 [Momordica charantia]|uniref:Uncharacterized protein LOC111017805 n=1 Tax=Momordica charantia TaxID=3673 RepID=A0A6J1D5J3_MOMCH|nr:uncharacterized protein LOC111017805 [Momordica charantia]
MERTETWDLVSLHAGHHAIGCMWVYCVKYNLDVSMDRYKARLVAKGYNQLEDNILITAPSLEVIASVKHLLHSHFKLKDFGTAKYFIGLELSRSSRGVYLSQRKYCLQIFEDSGFLGEGSVSFPMTSNCKLCASSGIPLSTDDATSYRRLVGRLLYLQISRLDISFVVHRLRQFLQRPCMGHLDAAHHLLSYLKGTIGQGILHLRASFQLKVFVDADWGACLDKQHYVYGFCIFLGDSLVS